MVKFSGETRTQADDDAKMKRVRRKFEPAPVPEWLKNLCSAEKKGQVGTFNPIADRGGARHNFDEVANIVRSMKSWCINNDCRLPAIEALPITAGLQAEADIKAFKTDLDRPQRLYNLAKNALRDAELKGKDTALFEAALEERRVALEAAQQKVEIAKQLLEFAKDTLPDKRVPKKMAEEQARQAGTDLATEVSQSIAQIGTAVDERRTQTPRRRGRSGSPQYAPVPTDKLAAQKAQQIEASLEEAERGQRQPYRGFDGGAPQAGGFRIAELAKELTDEDIDALLAARAARITESTPMTRRLLTNKRLKTSHDIDDPSSLFAVQPQASQATRAISSPVSPKTRRIPRTPSKQPVQALTGSESGTTSRVRKGRSSRFSKTPFARGAGKRAINIDDESQDDEIVITNVVPIESSKRKKRRRRAVWVSDPRIELESDTDSSV
jgi:hypothetical protein